MKKIIAIIVLISLMFNFQEVYAYEKIENLKLEKIKDCESLLKYQNKIIRTSYITTKIGEIEYPCYCINPDLPGVGECGSYEVNGSELIDKNSLIYKAIINGYPYKSLEELGVNSIDEAFTATKQAIYIMIRGRYNEMSEYSAVNTDAGARTLVAMKNIVQKAMSNENEVFKIQEKDEWKIEKDFMYKEYEIIGNIKDDYSINIRGNIAENYEIQKKNNSFILKVPLKNMYENVDFVIELECIAKINPIIYGKSENNEKQDYAVAGILFDNIKLEYEDSYEKNTTTLKIIKQDKETKEKLKNVKFEILNNNKEKIYNELVTNEEGEIIIENMIPGIYYIREIETLEEYEIYKELIEVTIKYNEENIINIDNIKKEIPENSDISKLPKTGF